MNYKFGRMWKKVVVSCMYQHMAVGAKKNHETFQSV